MQGGGGEGEVGQPGRQRGLQGEVPRVQRLEDPRQGPEVESPGVGGAQRGWDQGGARIPSGKTQRKSSPPPSPLPWGGVLSRQ